MEIVSDEEALKAVEEYEKAGETKFTNGRERIKVVYFDAWGNRMVLPIYKWLEIENLELNYKKVKGRK